MAEVASSAAAAAGGTVAAKSFKGVMLCDRPAADAVASKWQDGNKYRPFLPTSRSAANEQLGLTPAYKVRDPTAARPPPPRRARPRKPRNGRSPPPRSSPLRLRARRSCRSARSVRTTR